jgi:hypothetical protein
MLHQPEILVLIRFSHAAGSKDFEFFSSHDLLCQKIFELPPLTSVFAFKQPQLPLRGIVDDDFILSCLRTIPDGSEYLLVETQLRIYGRASWYHNIAGTSHSELTEDLNDSRGLPVAVGVYPPWLEDCDDVISAVVPNELDETTGGVY